MRLACAIHRSGCPGDTSSVMERAKPLATEIFNWLAASRWDRRDLAVRLESLAQAASNVDARQAAGSSGLVVREAQRAYDFQTGAAPHTNDPASAAPVLLNGRPIDLRPGKGA